MCIVKIRKHKLSQLTIKTTIVVLRTKSRVHTADEYTPSCTKTTPTPNNPNLVTARSSPIHKHLRTSRAARTTFRFFYSFLFCQCCIILSTQIFVFFFACISLLRKRFEFYRKKKLKRFTKQKTLEEQPKNIKKNPKTTTKKQDKPV